MGNPLTAAIFYLSRFPVALTRPGTGRPLPLAGEVTDGKSDGPGCARALHRGTSDVEDDSDGWAKGPQGPG
jgi:hypothetical protein